MIKKNPKLQIVKKPQAKLNLDPKLKNKLNQIRKILQLDGGDLEVISFDKAKNIIIIELKGVCNHCPMAEMTIKGTIESELRKILPKIKVQRF